MVGICVISSCHQRYIDLESTYNEAMKIVMMPDLAVNPLRGVKYEKEKKDDAEEIPQVAIYKIDTTICKI